MCTMEWHDVEREIYTGPLQENPQEYCNRQMAQKKSHMSESRASNLRRKKNRKKNLWQQVNLVVFAHQKKSILKPTREKDVIGAYKVLGRNLFQLVERFKPQFLFFWHVFSQPFKMRKKSI